MKYIVDPIQVVRPIDTPWLIRESGPEELISEETMFVDTESEFSTPCTGPFNCKVKPNF